MNDIDPRTIAADIMCGNARDITPGEVWAHIGQAYDVAEIDASIADEVADLIAKTGIDLIWPDGTTNTELDAARVEIERLHAERTDMELNPTGTAEWLKHLVAELTAKLTKTEDQLTAANRRADGLEADLRSASTAVTNYANENGRLRTALLDVAKTSGTTHVWDHQATDWVPVTKYAAQKTEATR